MTNLREYAKGKPCMVRCPSICNGNWDTTVLAHDNTPGVSGMAMKSPDIIAAWACSACHDEIDRRTMIHRPQDVRLWHLEGIVRTQAELINDGVLKA